MNEHGKNKLDIMLSLILSINLLKESNTFPLLKNKTKFEKG